MLSLEVEVARIAPRRASDAGGFHPLVTLRDTQRDMSGESTTPDVVELGERLLGAANCPHLDAMPSFFAPDAVWETWVWVPPLKA